MKTSEILILATKHLRGHINCCESDTSDFICNAIDRVAELSEQQKDRAQKKVVMEIRVFASYHKIAVHGVDLPLINYLRKLHDEIYTSASDPGYWRHRDEWLTGFIEKLQKAGD